MSFLSSLRSLFSPPAGRRDLAVSSVVDDSGFTGLTSTHDQDPALVLENYNDALIAWRRNPIAWRIIAITTDYVLGDSIQVSSPLRPLRNFINSFWNHPKNRMDNRLESMCDELSRSGDLFVLLFRNPQDGMSYVRFVTKDRIQRIETAPNDYETELAFYERQDVGEPLRWPSPHAADAADAPAVMLHYAVNRPLGALLGESDLTSMLPWLLRYSRMLEDRVRLHWAVRSFLWMVTVPTNMIAEKRQQYRQPPEAGSIVIKDSAEHWEAVSPELRGADAQHDLKAVRGMIDAGSGYPPHWRGESGDANLATATAMQAPTERHLARRQQYFVFILQDILYYAYIRSTGISTPRLKSANYSDLFTIQAPDISRTDNESLARAAQSLCSAFQTLQKTLVIPTAPALTRRMIEMVFRFAGEPLPDDLLNTITSEVTHARENNVPPTDPAGPDAPARPDPAA